MSVDANDAFQCAWRDQVSPRRVFDFVLKEAHFAYSVRVACRTLLGILREVRGSEDGPASKGSFSRLDPAIDVCERLLACLDRGDVLSMGSDDLVQYLEMLLARSEAVRRLTERALSIPQATLPMQ